MDNSKWGSFFCEKYKFGGKCDLCAHMKETETIESIYYQTKFKIHGHLRHDYSPDGKIRWFLYSIRDIPCQKIIVGSTQNPLERWRNYKSTCNKENSNSTGLSKHFMDGCPFDTGKEKMTLRYTLIDYFDTTQEKLRQSAHVPGPRCRCSECGHLKDLENRWIMKIGSMYGTSGLNERDEMKAKQF